jgi:hypothetical protein
MGAIFAFLFFYRENDPYEYQIPYIDEVAQEKHMAWESMFENNMELATEQIPSYDNVVIWGFDADTPKGRQLFDWRILYALPKGFGISCCMQDYLITQGQNLQSRYIAVCADSTLDQLYQQAGYLEIGRSEGSVVYDRSGQ